MKRLIPIISVLILALILSYTPACQKAVPTEEILEEEVAEETTPAETTAEAEETTIEEVEPTPNALLIACRKGNLEEVKRLLAQGVDANAKDSIGMTALMCAAYNGHTETAELLIDNGADTEATDNKDNTALLYAATWGHADTVGLLIDKGADINTITNIGKTALIGAAEKGHTDTVGLLIDKGADINVRDNYGITAFMRAVYFGHKETENLLKEKGACEIPGQTPSLAIELTSDILYANIDDRPTSLDVFSPRQKGPWPVVIVVHGSSQDRSSFENFSRAIASQGAVVFNIDTTFGVSAVIERVACAVRFARATSPDYDGDPSRIIIVGFSRGARCGLVASLAGDDFRGDCVISDGSALPDAFVGYEGGYDFTTSDASYRTPGTNDAYYYIGQNPDLQVRLIYGDVGHYVTVSIEMHQALANAGYDVELHVVEGAGHSLNPDSYSFAPMIKQVMEVVRDSSQ